jgi:hypothetical protein
MSTVNTVTIAEEAKLEADQSLMSWPDPNEGDVKKIWSRNNPDEVADARRSFDDLVGKGFRAFRVTGEDGERGGSMRSFDPKAERMILIPPMVGG